MDATIPSPGNSSLPRRSCDWCHKQKLRCTRTNKGLGGICDRCYRRKAPCVYSYSLPRGRPTLLQTQPPISSSLPQTTTTTTQDQVPLQVSSLDDTTMRPMSNHSSRAWNGHGLGEIGEHSMTINDIGLATPPRSTMTIDATASSSDWGDPNLEADWEEITRFCATFDLELASPQHIPPPPQLPLSVPQPLLPPKAPSGDEQQAAEYGGTVCKVIGQLSELAVRLSTLRSSGHALLRAIEACAHTRQQAPLLDASSYESVTGWLTQGLGQPSPLPPLAPSPQTSTPDGEGLILSQTFSASHRLLEILRPLEPFHYLTTGPVATTGSQIMMNLLLASEALLLEIYQAILTAMQCDAAFGACRGHGALEDVRLVFVVQLCSYFIQRQQQGIDACLGPSRPGSAMGTRPQKGYLAGPNSLEPVTHGPDKEIICHLKQQVMARVQQLRGVLQCP